MPFKRQSSVLASFEDLIGHLAFVVKVLSFSPFPSAAVVSCGCVSGAPWHNSPDWQTLKCLPVRERKKTALVFDMLTRKLKNVSRSSLRSVRVPTSGYNSPS